MGSPARGGGGGRGGRRPGLLLPRARRTRRRRTGARRGAGGRRRCLCPGGGHARRLAGGADRRRRDRADRPQREAGVVAGRPPAARRRGGHRGGACRVPRPASRSPGVRRGRSPLLRGQLLLPHRHLQGDGRRGPARRLLPGPAGRALRIRARDLPLPVLHQHQPLVGAGAAVPDAVSQRRDQHDRRQPERHARPTGPVRGRRPVRGRGRLGDGRDARPGDRGRAVGLRQARRGARAPRPGWARHPPRAGHAGATGVGGRPRPRAGDPRLLPLPVLPRRALGRSRRSDLHRRSPRRRRPRPQRPPTAAVPRL